MRKALKAQAKHVLWGKTKGKEGKKINRVHSEKIKAALAKKKLTRHGMMTRLINDPLAKVYKCGDVIRFRYDGKKPIGEPMGWHHDPEPMLLMLYDDGWKFWEGINLNYLSHTYVTRLARLVKRFPGIDGTDLYPIIKRTAPIAAKVAYRKYYRKVARNRRMIQKFV